MTASSNAYRYPACFFVNVQIPGRSGPGNLHYLPDTKIVVPLLVQMGDLNTETPAKDCISRLQAQKGQGSAHPVRRSQERNAWLRHRERLDEESDNGVRRTGIRFPQ